MIINKTAILLIAAPDKKGLVYALTDYIYHNNGNILHAEQHIDLSNNIFFMRIEWDMGTFGIEKAAIWASLEKIKIEYQMHMSLYFSEDKISTAIYISQTDHCLLELLYNNNQNNLMEIKLIVSNHEKHREIATYYNIPFYFIPIFKENKGLQEGRQLSLMQEQKIELIVLARYMQILSPDFVGLFPHKIINVHHSFLPAFVGADPYKQAYNRGVKIIGSTAHYVTDTLDDGPIISQQTVAVSHKDKYEDFVEKGKHLEKQVLLTATRKHLEHKILVFDNKTVVFD